MKRKRFLLPLCLLTVALGAATAQPPLRSAAEPDYPPFSMVTSEGGADGFAVDLLKAATKAMGLDITFATGPWNQIKSELATGELDVLPLVGRTPEREALYDFTVPYLTLHGALFVRDDESEIRSLADLPGKRIAVMKGDNAEEYALRSNLSDDMVSTPTFEEAFRMLAAGKADAVIAQKLMGVSLLEQLGLRNIQVVGRPNEEFKQDFCFAVQKGNAELLSMLNEGLAIVVANGTQRALMSKWLGTSETSTARSRVLIYGDDWAYPPYAFLDKQGRPAGFHIELLRAVSAKTGIDVAFQLERWSEVRRKMSNGELDITSMFYTPQRDQLVDFSLPHSTMYAAVFTRTGAPPYQTVDDLKGCRIAVQNGDRLHEYALAQGWGETLSVTANLEESMALLANGNVDFALCYHIPGLHWIAENGWKNIRTAEAHLMKTEYCFAVQEGNHELQSLLNDGLRQLKQTGEYQTIYNKWLGAFDETRRPLPLWFWIVLCGISALVLLLFGANRLLKYQVNKRTAELRESEERFDIAVDAATIGVWDFDILTEQLVWDKRMFQLYGISPDEFTGAYEAWHSGLHPEDRQRAMDEVTAATSGQKSFNTEFRIIRPDGEIRYIRAIAKVIRSKTGTPLRMIGINYDITELIDARLALQEGEEKYRALFENAPLSYQSLNEDGYFIDVNPAWLRTLGYARDEVIGKWFGDFLHPDFTPHFETNFPAFKKRGYVNGVQYKIRRKDGTYRDIQFEGCIGYLPDGSFRQTYCVFQDITERLEAEAALRASEEEFRNLAESMPQIVWATRADGWNIYFNQQWVDYTGLTLEESYGHGWNKPFHPDDQQRAWDAWQNATQHNASYSLECRLRRFDGTYRWWLVRGVPQLNEAGETVKWFGTCTDIEQVKQAESAQHESDQNFRTMIETLPLAIYLSSGTEQVCEYLNPAFISLFGYTIEDVPTAADWYLIAYPAPDYRKEIVDEWSRRVQRAIETQSLIEPVEAEVTCKDGSTKTILWGFKTIGNKNYAYGIDLTERKRQELELRENRKLLGDVVDAMPDMLWMKDPDGKYLLCNREFEKLVKSTREQIVGQTDYDLFPKEKADFYKGRDQIAIQNGTTTTNEESADYTADGYSIWIETTKTCVYDQQGGLVGLLGIGRDISHRKQAQAEAEARQEFLNLVLDRSPIPMWVGSPDGTTLRANHALYATMNLTPEQIVGKYNLLKDDNLKQPDIAKKISRLFNEKIPIQFEAVWRSGEVESVDFSGGRDLYIDVSIYPLLDPDGEIAHILCQWVDFTERKQVEEALAESEQRLNEAQRLASVGSWMQDVRSNQLIWSDETYRIFEIEKEYAGELLDVFFSAVHPDDKEAVVEAYENSLTTKKPYEITHRLLLSGGRVKYVHEWSETEYDVSGNPIKTIGTVQDITERKRAEKALLASERKLQLIIDTSPIGICTVDPLGNYVMANRAYEQMLGYSKEELRGLSFFEVTHPDDRPANKKLFRDMISSQTERFFVEKRYVRKDGTVIDVAVNASGIMNAEGDARFGTAFVNDITERKRAEAKLAEQLDELRRWRDAMVGRENRVIEIKQEVNELLARIGEPPRYVSATEKEPEE